LEQNSAVWIERAVSDDALPQLVSVIDELKRQALNLGSIELPDCHLQTHVRNVDLSSALKNIDGISQNPAKRAFVIAISGSNIELQVNYDEPVTVNHLCTIYVED